MDASHLIRSSTLGIQQGDIMIATGVVRLSSTSDQPVAWQSVDAVRTQLVPSFAGMSALDAIGGSAVVMVTSHDCQLDKEFNATVNRLMREGVDEASAIALAEQDASLDQNVQVSPIVPVLDVARGDKGQAGNIRAGRVIGAYPLPDAEDAGLRDVAVDLSYRATVDRSTFIRLYSLSEEARIQLRYALAKMDALRTPDFGTELESAIGKRIAAVDRPNHKRTTVQLRLEDGSVLELLPRPGTSIDDGPRRRSPV